MNSRATEAAPVQNVQGAAPARPRALVLDTNIVLDLLLFGDAATQPLQQALALGAFDWMATDAMREELARVLDYPNIRPHLRPGQHSAASVLAAFDQRVRLVAVAAKAPFTCTDADDQKFIDLAAAHQAHLLSKDKAVLRLGKRLASLGVEVAQVLHGKPLPHALHRR